VLSQSPSLFLLYDILLVLHICRPLYIYIYIYIISYCNFCRVYHLSEFLKFCVQNLAKFSPPPKTRDKLVDFKKKTNENPKQTFPNFFWLKKKKRQTLSPLPSPPHPKKKKKKKTGSHDNEYEIKMTKLYIYIYICVCVSLSLFYKFCCKLTQPAILHGCYARYTTWPK